MNCGQRICGSRKLSPSKTCNIPNKGSSFFYILRPPFWLKLHNVANQIADLFALVEIRLSDVVINSWLRGAISNSLPSWNSLFYFLHCGKAVLRKPRRWSCSCTRQIRFLRQTFPIVFKIDEGILIDSPFDTLNILAELILTLSGLFHNE